MAFLSILTLIFVLKRNTKRNAVQKVQKHGRLSKYIVVHDVLENSGNVTSFTTF